MDAKNGCLPIIAAAGLDFEAAAARGPGVTVVRGLNRRSYRQQLHEQARRGVCGIISFGVAGGLSPELRAGDIVVASSVVTAAGEMRTCEKWSSSLLASLPQARYLQVFGSQLPLLSVIEKQALWKATGSATVDVESSDAAAIAAYYRLPYAVLRIVLDPAHRAIPISALAGVDEDGNTDARAVAKILARRPRDLPGLLCLASDTRKANISLHKARRQLGPHFAFNAPSDGAAASFASAALPRNYAYAEQFRSALDTLVLILPRWIAACRRR